MAAGLRAAIIGAGRIGRHHAKWYDRSGCTVAGYVVSEPAHLPAREAELRPDCPSLGAGYADVDAMLDEVRPDLVSVCSPPAAHYAHARAALERGIPVLCEKPLVWDDDPATARAQAAQLVALADARGVALAVNLQYTYAAALYEQLVGRVEAPRTCAVSLSSRGRGERQPDEVWMELGPHALSLAFGLLPGYSLAADSVAVETAPRTCRARFTLRGPAGAVATTVETAQVLEGDLTRCFGLDGRRVDVAGRNNASGEFCTYLAHAGVEQEFTDLMRTSIERFVATVAAGGTPAVDGELGRRNLEAQLAIAAGMKQKPEDAVNG